MCSILIIFHLKRVPSVYAFLAGSLVSILFGSKVMQEKICHMASIDAIGCAKLDKVIAFPKISQGFFLLAEPNGQVCLAQRRKTRSMSENSRRSFFSPVDERGVQLFSHVLMKGGFSNVSRSLLALFSPLPPTAPRFVFRASSHWQRPEHQEARNRFNQA